MNELYEFVAYMVDRHMIERGKKRNDIASAIGVSESFVNKVHHGTKHYNTKHLFLIANDFSLEVSSFFPNKVNYEILYPNKSQKEYQEWYNEILLKSRGNVDE